MEAKLQGHSKHVDDWAGLESFLSQNFQPVEPRPLFKDNLRQRLGYVETTTLEGSGQAKFYFLLLTALVSGLCLVAVWIRLMVPLLTKFRFPRRSASFSKTQSESRFIQV